MLNVVLSVDGGGVYIVGQPIHCRLTISNTSDASDRLAWATGQLSGHVKVDERYVKLHQDDSSNVTLHSTTNLSHASEGCFFSSDPQIVCCDLQLVPGADKKLEFSGVIPTHSPPSFRGSFVKYSYSVVVGVQRVGQPITLITLPIKIINIPGIGNPESPPALTHPFEPIQMSVSYQDYFMDKVQSLCSKKPRNFEVKSSEGLVATVKLVRAAYKLGDPIDITVAFGDVQCVQVTTKLQALEAVSPESQLGEANVSRTTSHCTHTMHCIHIKDTVITLNIPLNVTNSFSTKITSVRWQVHFTFVVTKLDNNAEICEAGLTSQSESGAGIEWRPLEELAVTTLSWEMPIRVVPTLPQYIATVAWQRTATTRVV